ncbi:helix-turn-helix domain-containing protein [Corynebacterium sp. A21]|uniref:helix-turn-helix domain-containing protein n=1 Tax=Corynebacterium sp. A21 TaxID=3457318 RepID=UPI003FD53576
MTGAELYAARSSYGMSLKDFARLVQVNERTLRRWEMGAPIPEEKAAMLWTIDQKLDECVKGILEHSRLPDGTLPQTMKLPSAVQEMPAWSRHIPLTFYVAACWRVAQGHGIRLIGQHDTWAPDPHT